MNQFPRPTRRPPQPVDGLVGPARGAATRIVEIDRDESRAKLERCDDFELVLGPGDWAYRAKHIPGSIDVLAPEVATAVPNPDDEIVVYCTNPTCIASRYAYKLLIESGYWSVRRDSGGLEDWEAAGLPLEGEAVLGAGP